MNRIRQATRQIVRDLDFLKGSFLETGCSAPEVHTLLELDLAGQLAVSQLADTLRQDKSTASRNVKALVERGLVKMVADPADGRGRLLSLTIAGQKKAEEINTLADGQVAQALSLLDEDQRRTVVDGILLYAKVLERGCKLLSIEIRPIEKRDNEAMANVIRSVMTEYGAVGAGYSIEDAELDDMHASYSADRAHFFVAVDGDLFLGGAGIGPLRGADEHVCELRKMYLIARARGIGLGQKLLERCLEAARESGYRECYLETLRHMSQARYLYDKFGFEPLDKPLGDTGHFKTDSWAIKELVRV